MLTQKRLELPKDMIEEYIVRLSESAESALQNINRILSESSAIDALELMKFNKIGCDPLNSSIKLNLIEQINQTFTYMASFLAAKYIFKNHELDGQTITLNLGTQGGSDIESADKSIIGEAFATTNIKNNKKLQEDIAKVKSVKDASFRYVFFIAPSIEEGPYSYNSKKIDTSGVTIISLKKMNPAHQISSF